MRLIQTLWVALATAACSAAMPVPEARSALVAKGRAIDGDTVSIDVRLLGADAFEHKQLCRIGNGCWPCGKAAQDLTSRMLKERTATIRLTGKASYGRPIGTVEIDGQDLGEAIIGAGLALPETDFLDRDPDRARRYVAAFDRAVARRAGAHAGYYIQPSKWRRGERLACERPAERGRDDRER